MNNQRQNEGFEIIQVEKEEHFEVIRTLFTEYQKELARDLSFQSFSDELANLPQKYNDANGGLLLLKDLEDDKFVGCVGLKTLKPQHCEMKRLYVQPDYRAKKYGLKLVHAILVLAKELNYQVMWLDTLTKLQPAIRLYKKLGFVETEPYYHNPYADVVFMRKEIG